MEHAEADDSWRGVHASASAYQRRKVMRTETNAMLSEGNLLVTGTGRCGTGWCRDVLRASCILAGHQDVIRHEHVLGQSKVDWRHYQAEVSYEACPLLWHGGGARLFEFGIRRVVLVVRHPLPTIRSWLRRCDFAGDLDSRFGALGDSIRLTSPEVMEARPGVERAARFWWRWNDLAMSRLPAGSVVRIDESTEPVDLLRACGLATDYLPRRPPVGTRDPTDPLRDVPELTWSDLGDERGPVENVARVFWDVKEQAT